MTKWIVGAVALLGLFVGLWMVTTAQENLPRPEPAQPPSINPFARGVAATGIVEASTRNVAIAPPEAGLVTAVHVQTNDQITVGQPLFELDDRALRSERLIAQGSLATAEAELARLQALPRPEDIPPLQAAVEQQQARLNDAADELQRTQQLFQSGAANERELRRAQYAMEETKASLEVAKAELARMKAGAWQQQIAIAQAQVEQARDTIAAIDVRLSRLKVLSPIAGTVIKRNIEPGEYTGAANMAQAAMVVGDVSTLHIRAQVNEEDVVEVQPGDKGMARTRGAFDELIPLTMLRIEPLAIPKRQLTGIPSEQVDTRVVEIIFQVQPGRKVPLYPGQLVDVYIQTQPE